MAITLPSPKIIIADAPEVTQFDAQFVYNYFEKDERQNDSGLISKEFALQKPAEGFDATFIDSKQFNRFTSRYVKFSWKSLLEPSSIIQKQNNITIKDNLQKIHYEQDFLAENYTGMVFQDNEIDQKLNFFVKKLINSQQNSSGSNINLIQQSPLDAAKVALEKTSNEIEPALICESISDLTQEGYVFLDGNGQKIQNTSILEEMKSVKSFAHLNSRFLWNIMKTGLEGDLSVFQDEILAGRDKFVQIQTTARNNAPDRSKIASEDYDLEIQEFVGQPRKMDINGYNPQKQIIGYIIDKTEIDINGATIQHSPVILENPLISTTIDLKIKYGSTYYYSIRSVAYVETQAQDSVTNEFYVVGYLLSSKSSLTKIVRCTEDVAPPPPADFDVRWDANRQKLVLNWNFPINSQRDIKQWQIFRRNSIDEPFELIKNYRFNDSTIIANDGAFEEPDPALIEIIDNPINFYTDLEFTKNKTTGAYPTFIYSVCSVDAHGYSSNYSIQMECTFDRFKNKLIKKMISLSGAPKPFPNFYLLSDTFVDVMRTSRKNKSVKIIFTPEYLKIIDNKNHDLGLIKTGINESYKLSLINLDVQEQQNIEIKINDKRRTDEKVIPLIIPTNQSFKTRRTVKPRNK